MKKNIIKIIALTLLLKLFYLIFALIISELNIGYHVDLNKQEFFSLFKRNDSYWYQNVAENGYPKITNALDLGYHSGKDFKQSAWGFFPFYPMAIHFTEKIVNLDFDNSAFILSLIFSCCSFIGFYLICIIIFKLNEKDSFIYTLFFMVFPFNYYFSMYYTEAFYFSFLAFSFISIYKKKYLVTGVLLIPLTLVRPNGIVCLLPLLIYYIEEQGGFKKVYSDMKEFRLQHYRNTIWFLSAPLALLGYCIYQKYMTGYYFAYVKAQSGWYKELMFPLAGLFRRGDFSTQFNSVYAIAFMIISIFTWKRFSLSMNILIWLSILLPLASGSSTSMPRYISVIFPLSIYMTSFFVKTKMTYVVMILMFLLQLSTFYFWLINDSFSV